MLISKRVSEVKSALQTDFDTALAKMAENVEEFFEDFALEEALLHPVIAEMFFVDGSRLDEDSQPAKSVRKDQRKMARLQAMTSSMYTGVPSRVAAWGHEAHSEGLRAFGMDRSEKASPERKAQAHHDASQAHQLAANKMDAGGHVTPAELHKRAAAYHKSRRHEIMKTAVGAKHLPMTAEAMPDMKDVHAHTHMAQWRMAQLKKKQASLKLKIAPKVEGVLSTLGHVATAIVAPEVGLPELGADLDIDGRMDKANKAKTALGVAKGFWLNKKENKKARNGKTEELQLEFIQNYFADLDEGDYDDDVKNASMMAANATKVAKQDHSTPDHHETAARLHFIAHGVAKVHGHEELAKKHKEFVAKHKEQAKQTKVA